MYFLLLVVLFSCKIQQETTIEYNQDLIEISHKTVTSKDNSVLRFTIKNKTNQELILLEPLVVRIEQKIGSEWKGIRILNCPCGAPCAPLKKEEIISQNESFKLSWNKKEEWCGELNEYGIPKSYSKLSNPGEYRLRINYRINNYIIRTKQYPFKLKY